MFNHYKLIFDLSFQGNTRFWSIHFAFLRFLIPPNDMIIFESSPKKIYTAGLQFFSFCTALIICVKNTTIFTTFLIKKSPRSKMLLLSFTVDENGVSFSKEKISLHLHSFHNPCYAIS